jgi:hypothetical protein
MKRLGTIFITLLCCLLFQSCITANFIMMNSILERYYSNQKTINGKVRLTLNPLSDYLVAVYKVGCFMDRPCIFSA